MPKAILFGVLLYGSISCLFMAIALIPALWSSELPAMNWIMFTIVLAAFAILAYSWIKYRSLSFETGNTEYPLKELHLTIISSIGLYFAISGASQAISATFFLFYSINFSNLEGIFPLGKALASKLPEYIPFLAGLALLFLPNFFYKLSTHFHKKA